MGTAKQILLGAADLLEKPGAWTQGKYARTASGNPIGPNEGAASCWCLLGAIDKVSPDLGHSNREAVWALGLLVPSMDVPGWNDAPGRTQAEAVAKLREAAERVGSQ